MVAAAAVCCCDGVFAVQATVLTQEVRDDMKATSLRDGMRSTAGVRVGR
jgi:hypothetical protein